MPPLMLGVMPAGGNDVVAMRAGLKFATVLLVGLMLGLVLGFFGARYGERVTLASLSPDEKTRVWIIERPHWVDRNFDVRIEDLETGNKRTVFSSPDEGRPVGSERIVWSADSTRFVLVGRNFLTLPNAQLPGGESLYLLHDLATEQVWCNAMQQDRYPPFSGEQLAGLNWNGQI